MDSVLYSTCEEFIKNRDLLKDEFKREGMVMHLTGAAMLASMEDAPGAEALIENEKTLKKLEGIFSPFRGVLKLPVVINMAMSEDPEEYLRLVRKAYDLICAKMGSRNERYYVPAMSVAAGAGSEDELAGRVDDNLALMTEDRSLDDLLAELGMSEDEIESAAAEVEEFLKAQKGFGALAGGAKMRKAYAKMLVCIAKSKEAGAADIVSADAVDKAMESRFRAAEMAQTQAALQGQLMLQTQILLQTQMTMLNTHL